MLILLSPAKKQDFDTRYPQYAATKAHAHTDTAMLITELKKLTSAQIGKLMNVSNSIAQLNYQRFQSFDPQNYNRNNAKQAIFAFRGDAYRALDVDSLKPNALEFLQQHLVILSGLYGYLRPLDLIQPYRLEMKTALKTAGGKDLYQFWGNKIAVGLKSLQKNHHNKTIINLASSEYFKAVSHALDEKNTITITFKEKKSGTYKVIGIHAKRARGAMTRYIAEKKITDPQKLTAFNIDGYRFNQSLSSTHEFVFTR